MDRDVWASIIGGGVAVLLGLLLIWWPPTSVANETGLFGTAIAFIVGGLAAFGVTVSTTALREGRRPLDAQEKVFVYVGALGSIIFGLILIYAGPSSIAGQATTFGTAMAFITGGAAAIGIAAKPAGFALNDEQKAVTYAGASLVALIGFGFLWSPPPIYTSQLASGGGFLLITLALSAVGVTVSMPKR